MYLHLALEQAMPMELARVEMLVGDIHAEQNNND